MPGVQASDVLVEMVFPHEVPELRGEGVSARHDKLVGLRTAAKALRAAGYTERDGALREVLDDIAEINQPEVGEILYNGNERVRVIAVEDGGYSVSFIPFDTAVSSTHQGNLDNENGVAIYYVAGESGFH